MTTEDINILKEEVESLKAQLLEQDANFSIKRAQFKDLYVKKEEELQKKLIMISAEKNNLQKELNDVQNVAKIADSFKNEELQTIREKYNNEVASITQIMRDNINSLNKNIENKDIKILKLGNENADLLKKLDEKNEEITEKTKNIVGNIAYKFKLNAQEILKNFQDTNNIDPVVDGAEADQHKSEDTHKEDIKILKNKIRQAYEEIDRLKASKDKAEDQNSQKMYYLENELKLQKVQEQFLRYENACKSIFTEKQNLELEVLLNNKMEPTLEFMKTLPQNSFEPIKKSVSGEIIFKAENVSPLVGKRRNTDIQSLKDFRVDSKTGDNEKVKLVNEEEKSRMIEKMKSMKSRSKNECEMCGNYEDQLQELQNRFKEKENKLSEVQCELTRQEKLVDHLKESSNKLSYQLNDKATQQQNVIESLSQKYNDLFESNSKNRNYSEKLRESTNKELKSVYSERLALKNRLDKIEGLYDDLLFKRAKNAREMEQEKIELPNSIEDAQFYLLRLKESLIESRAAIEHLNTNMQSSEIFNKERTAADKQERDAIIDELMKEKTELEDRVSKLEVELDKRNKFSAASDSLEETIQVLKKELDVVKRNFTNADTENRQLKSRLQSLQLELENSESVQKDFVKLSQTLQIQLESLRQEDRELRWQFDEDISKCNDCKSEFSSQITASVPISTGFDFNSRKRYHCLHCGKIFCKQCLVDLRASNTSGTSKSTNRQANVCKMCHTLLVKDAVPYFSLTK